MRKGKWKKLFLAPASAVPTPAVLTVSKARPKMTNGGGPQRKEANQGQKQDVPGKVGEKRSAEDALVTQAKVLSLRSQSGQHTHLVKPWLYPISWLRSPVPDKQSILHTTCNDV